MLNKKSLFALIAVVATVPAFAATQCEKHPEAEQIPAAKFQEQLKAQGYQIRNFKKTSGNCYEIYGKNKAGQRVEIYFDTKTGKPVKSEIED